VGVFRRKSTLKKALKRGAVTAATMDLAKGVKDADLVIIASPVRSIPSLAKEVLKHIKEGAVITDVGSTKAWITKDIARALNRRKDVFFVGSHPMAGSEHAGVEFARQDLLEDSPCIVTKDKFTKRRALAKVIGFWKSLGSKVSVMTPDEHDRSVSLVSHLPHLVAFSLALAVPGKDLKYAAEGFKDTTRVASSDPKLWADILLSNRNHILKAASLFGATYRELVSSLSKNDYDGVVKFIKAAKSKRDRYIHAKAR
jgi:prephenate dehydrogenase